MLGLRSAACQPSTCLLQPMQFHYLDFDYSEDAEGTGTFDAMASVAPAQVAALYAEVSELLSWAHTQFPDACRAQEDGGDWQYDLQGAREHTTPLALEFDAVDLCLRSVAHAAAEPRTTVTVSISGNAEFCATLRAAFALD